MPVNAVRTDNDCGSDNDYIIKDPADDRLDAGRIDMDCLPVVSFCIPTLNNARTLGRCLESIAGQEYPGIEIVIVDGHSTDGTIDIARRYTDRIFFDDGPLGGARQRSIDESTGEVVALFDSDIIIPHRRWLIDSIKYFNYSDRVSTVWPVNLAPEGASPFSRLYFNFWKITMEDRISRRRGVYGGGNALFLRRFIDAAGGIDRSIHWGEDFDLAWKLKGRGCQVVFISDPLYHDTMGSMKEYARKQATGAKTFTKTGTGIMGLTKGEIFYEHFILGVRGMIKGLLLDREISWAVYPAFLTIRVGAYAYVFLRNLTDRWGRAF